MEREFEGRHVVVTGGTGALGTAVVERLLQGRASVTVPVLDAEELRIFPYRASVSIWEDVNLTEEAAVERFYRDAVAARGPLWASLHMAGGFAAAPIRQTSGEDFLRQFRLNALTCFLCSRHAVLAMRAGGRIVNVAARPAMIPEMGAGMIAYTVSKAAVAALTQALAAEVAREGILVNAVVPAVLDTPANRRAMPQGDFSSWAKVEEVAETIAHLASPRNCVTRGALVTVYGRG